MNAITLCLQLLNVSQFQIGGITIEGGKISISLERKSYQASCPKCKQESNSIHSSYLRCPTDLAWAE